MDRSLIPLLADSSVGTGGQLPITNYPLLLLPTSDLGLPTSDFPLVTNYKLQITNYELFYAPEIFYSEEGK